MKVLRVRGSFLAGALALAACGPAGALDAGEGGAAFDASGDVVEEGALIDAPAVDAPAVDAAPVDAYVPAAPPARYAMGLEQLQTSLREAHIPGAAVAIIEGGRLSYAAGYGVRRAGRAPQVTEHTRFRVGSIMKMVTASAALSLVDEGRLDLAQPVTRYVPTLRLRAPADVSRVTTHMLLTHSSGLPDDLTYMCPVGDGALAQLARDRADTPLWAPPGAVFNYSNLGYALAGLVAETAGGVPFDELIRRRVLVPAGMTEASFDGAAVKRTEYATGHTVSASGGVGLTFEPDNYDCAGAHPAGYLFASVLDYAHFIETLLAGGGTMLSRERVAELWGDQQETRATPVEHYGYGWYRYPYRGESMAYHSGFVLGWETAIYVLPERDTAVVLFINANPATFSVSSAARALLLSFAELTGANAGYTTSPSTWGPYAGTYVDPYNLGRIVVTQSGTTLSATIENRATGTPMSGRLVQIAGDHFVFDGATDLSMTFWRDTADGPARYFVSRSGVGVRSE